MKNIHIIPTDQPSRLVKIKDTFFITSSVDIPGGTFYNIYITSDEEIKKGDWYLNIEEKNGIKNPFYGKLYKANQSIGKVSLDYLVNNLKKIILSTDPTLIADGVQAIDDEFLKWFVKNSSCEFINVEKEELKSIYNPNYKDFTTEGYGIYLTPKDRPLQTNESPLWDDGFIAGFKYQAENMFSKEEVDLLVNQLINKFTDWSGSYVYKDKLIEMYEQFKKK